MSIHIIVDGYNVIYQSVWFGDPDQHGIQFGRDALIDALAVYKRAKGYRITVVFDGVDMPPAHRQRDRRNGIEIKFSRSSETADQVINRMVKKEKQRVMVVSCDREIISFAESYGASVINLPTFERKVLMINFLLKEDLEKENKCSKGKYTTRKKGPSKRLPKNKRKHQNRIKKL